VTAPVRLKTGHWFSNLLGLWTPVGVFWVSMFIDTHFPGFHFFIVTGVFPVYQHLRFVLIKPGLSVSRFNETRGFGFPGLLAPNFRVSQILNTLLSVILN
jgi:hypothetical protein